MGSRGQTVIELLLLLTISILALSIIYSIYSTQIEYSNISRESLIAKSTINKIVNSANSLALSGAGSTQKILIEIPSDANLLDSNIIGKTILITLSNGSSVFGSADVNIVGEFKKSGGLFVVDGYFVNLTFDGEKVVMSYDDFELNNNSFFVSAKQGTSIQKVFTIRNNSSREATFWISKDFSFSPAALMNINSDDLYFTLSPNEVKIIDFNIVLSTFSSGNYAGKINIIGQINDGVSDTNISKSVVVSVESFLEFAPVMILPKSTSFIAQSGTSTVKSYSLCNSTESNISVSWQRASNTDANMLDWFNWPILDADGIAITSIASGDCAYFDLNFTVPLSALTKTYDANITVTYGDGNISNAYFFVEVSHNILPYSSFFTTSNNTLSANYFLSSFVTQKTDANYFVATGELDWNLSDTGSELDSSNYLYDANLIALWHFNDKNSDGWILNSKTGVRDVSLNGTANINTIGLWGTNALSLNGVDGGANLPDVSLSSTFSYSAWIYPIHSTGMTWNSLFANDCDVGIYYMEDSQKISFYYSETDHFTNTPLVESMWHHVVVTNNAGSVKFYIDGVADGSASSAPGFIANKIGTDSCGEAFNGYIDEVGVWNRELTETEVGALYVSQSSGLDENLVAYYKFNDKNSSNWILNSATGVRDGQLIGDASVSAQGMWDTNAGHFDGSDDYVSIQNLNSFNLQEFSVSLWVYPATSGTTGGREIIDKYYSSPDPYISWGIQYTDGDKFAFSIDDGGYKQNKGNGVYSPGNYYFLTMVVSNSSVKGYVNGNLDLEYTRNGTIRYNSNPVVLGRWVGSSSADEYFNGLMDEVKIYNRTLSDSEILQDYNSFLTAKFVSGNVVDATTVSDWNSLMVNSDVNYSFGREIDVNEKFSDGLVGLWHMNDKNASNYVLNSATINFDGELKNGASVDSTGLWDTNAGYFDGVDDYVKVFTSVSYKTPTLSWGAWVNPTAKVNYGKILSLDYTANGSWPSPYVSFDLESSNGSSGHACARVTVNGTVYPSIGVTESSMVLPLNQWTYLIATYDGADLKLYQNASLVMTVHAVGSIDYGTSKELAIGTDSPYYIVENFKGYIDEVAIWNKSLSASEVSELYRKGISRLDLNIYSCSDSLCETKTGTQNISNVQNSVWVNLNSSVLNSRYLGIEAYFLKAKGFEDYNAENFWVGSYLKDFNILFYN